MTVASAAGDAGNFLVVEAIVGFIVVACCVPRATPAESQHTVKKDPFGGALGDPVEIYTLTNAYGLEMRATNYGGIADLAKCCCAGGSRALRG